MALSCFDPQVYYQPDSLSLQIIQALSEIKLDQCQPFDYQNQFGELKSMRVA